MLASLGGGSTLSERFDKFTAGAKRVLVLAQEEAQRFNHNYIGTEHLLLGLVRVEEGQAVTVLRDLNAGPDRVRHAVEAVVGRGDRMVIGDISLTPRAKKAIELTVEEARRLNRNHIDTEHLLLGLVREGEGVAAGVLTSLGLDLEQVREAVVRAANQADAGPTPAGGPVVRPRPEDATASTPTTPGSGPADQPVARLATAADLDFTVHTTYIPADRMQLLVQQRQVVVAELAGERVGYACLDWLVVVAPFLGAIWVREAHRRRGVGTALLRFLEDALRDQGHEVLYSSCVVTETEPQAWHRRVGFRECGLIAEFNDGGVGEVFLRKPLRGDAM